MELKLLPEDIDKLIRETVLKSALGKNIEQTIDKAVADAVGGYNSPIKKLVNDVVSGIIEEQLQKPEYRQKITDALIAKITPKTIEDMITYGAEKLREYCKDYD